MMMHSLQLQNLIEPTTYDQTVLFNEKLRNHRRQTYGFCALRLQIVMIAIVVPN